MQGLTLAPVPENFEQLIGGNTKVSEQVTHEVCLAMTRIASQQNQPGTGPRFSVEELSEKKLHCFCLDVQEALLLVFLVNLGVVGIKRYMTDKPLHCTVLPWCVQSMRP
jgi:hypothetical protein